MPNLINNYPERASNGEWDDALRLIDAMQYFLHCSRGLEAIPVGQNFFFDWSFLSAGFAYCDIPESVWGKSLHYSRLDIRSMSAQALLKSGESYNPDDFSLRKNTLSDKLKISDESFPHIAINGARQAYLVYRELYRLRVGR